MKEFLDEGPKHREPEKHGPCGDGAVGEHGGPDDRHCRVCIDKSCQYNQPMMASEDMEARAALREATKQEGWFDEYFLTRVMERLDGQGYRITKVA